jgi:hypothetical protein
MDSQLQRLAPETALRFFLNSHQVFSNHQLQLIVNRRKIPLFVYSDECSIGGVQVFQQELTILKKQFTVLPTNAFLLEFDVTIGISADSDGRSVVKVDDVFLNLGIGVVSVAKNDEGRMDETLAVQGIFFALVSDCPVDLLLADLATHVVLKIFVAIRSLSL